MASRLDRTKPDKINGIPVTGLANLRWLLLQLQWSRSEQVQRCSNMVQTFCKLSSRLNSQCNLAFVAADSGAVGCKDHQNPVWYTRASIEFHHSNTEIIYGSQNPGWDLVHVQVVQGLPLSPCLAGVFSLFTLEPFQSEVLRNIRCDDQQRHKADDLAWGKEFCA